MATSRASRAQARAADQPCPEAETMARGAARREAPVAAEQVQEAFARALRRMRDAGFDVGDGVAVAVDPQLPHMGYTRPEGGGFRIVVAAWSVESGMLDGLLVHELSHIRRIRTGHPSHDPRVLGAAADVMEGCASTQAQWKTVHDLLNNVQDLYADDLAFQVLLGTEPATKERVTRFLQDWVTESPERTGDPLRDRWANAWLLANNARAIAQMRRHGVEDRDGKAAEASARFIAQVRPGAAAHFQPLVELLAGLPEDIEPEALRDLLAGYLERFVRIVDALR